MVEEKKEEKKKVKEKKTGMAIFHNKKVMIRFLKGKSFMDVPCTLLDVDRGWMIVKREDGVVAAYSQTPQTRIKFAK